MLISVIVCLFVLVLAAFLRICLRPMTFCLTFDDGLKAHATVAGPMLAARGWSGAFNVPTHLIDGEVLSSQQAKDLCLVGNEDKLMDWADVRNLLDLGHEVYPHTCDHADMPTLEKNCQFCEIERQIVEAKDRFVLKTGASPKFFCFPHNATTPYVNAIVRKNGMEPFSCFRQNFGEPGHKNFFGTVTEYLQKCRRSGFLHVDCMIHGITRSEGGWRPFESVAEFESFLDEIEALERAHAIRVVSYSSSHTMNTFFAPIHWIIRRGVSKVRRGLYQLF